ncbi:MAG: DUF4956 domain-containing protein [Reichenbachiella sp.]
MNVLLMLLLKFWYTLAIIFVLSRFIYYPNKGKKEYFFTFVLMSATIFLICLLVQKVEISLGFALGIFAVFGIIRYRTVSISTREMTYIFVCAGVAAKNSLLPLETSFDRILITDLSLLMVAGALEYFLFRAPALISKKIVYNQLDLIHPDKRVELEEQLGTSFGITNIKKIKVGKIDLLKKSANLNVFFVDSHDDHISNTKD